MTQSAKDRLLLSRAMCAVRLSTGPHPTRETLEAACAIAARDCPELAQTAIFAAMSGASEWAAARARTMM
jgi:hypothetical protein